MHEMSLIQFTMEAVENKCQELEIDKVRSITVVAGQSRGVVPELMQRSFRLLRRTNPLFQDTELKVETRPGEELYIASFEVGEQEDDR